MSCDLAWFSLYAICIYTLCTRTSYAGCDDSLSAGEQNCYNIQNIKCSLSYILDGFFSILLHFVMALCRNLQNIIVKLHVLKRYYANTVREQKYWCVARVAINEWGKNDVSNGYIYLIRGQRLLRGSVGAYWCGSRWTIRANWMGLAQAARDD